jgi:hypothetical protein
MCFRISSVLAVIRLVRKHNQLSWNKRNLSAGGTANRGMIDGGANFNGSQYASKTSPAGIPTGSAARTLSLRSLQGIRFRAGV